MGNGQWHSAMDSYARQVVGESESMGHRRQSQSAPRPQNERRTADTIRSLA